MLHSIPNKQNFSEIGIRINDVTTPIEMMDNICDDKQKTTNK